MSTDVLEIGPVPDTWTRTNLLDVESLSAEEIITILDSAEMFRGADGQTLNVNY